MFSFGRMLTLAVVCLAGFSAAQVPDQLVAERVLGPRWRQMARSSGMIFSGTVLEIVAQPVATGRPLPLVLTKFRVDRAIAGVHAREVITVHEWTGALAMQRPMRRGERVLIFFYAPSRMGLTSPVGGRLGQVALDVRGEIVAGNRRREFFPGFQFTPPAEAAVEYPASAARLKPCPPGKPSLNSFPARSPGRLNAAAIPQVPRCATLIPPMSGPRTARGSPFDQLERAIRATRLHSAVNRRRNHARPTSGN